VVNSRRLVMSWVELCLLLLVLLGSTSCKQVLGIDARELDVAELTVDGYEGCEPSDGICDGCTSAWHSCICEGWKSKPEAVLRRDCADEAPTSIREKVVAKAEEEFEDYERELAASKRDDDKPPTKPNAADDDAGSGPSPSEPDPPPAPKSELSELSVFNESFCDFDQPPDDCQGCFCGECTAAIENCQDDIACATIMDCFMTEKCDPVMETSATFCGKAEYCGDVIAENGGPGGPANKLAHDTLKCSVDSQCPCGESAQPGPAQGTCMDGNCNACPDCWGRCFCEGKSDNECRQECGSPNCTVANECIPCNDCMDSCLCDGFLDRNQCRDVCTPGGQSCKPEYDCDCDNCFDACLCGGGDGPSCDDECSQGIGGLCAPNDDCFACSTCGGACYCDNPDADFTATCMTDCEIDGCSVGDCSTCNSCQAECECETGDPMQCMQDCLGLSCTMSFGGDCDACLCEQCTSQFAICESHQACPPLVQCMRATGCFDPYDCDRADACGPEVAALGGPSDPIMGLVEALVACERASSCACGGSIGPGPAGTAPQPPPQGPPEPITCGSDSCPALILPDPDPISAPCCLGADGSGCGIEGGPIFGPDHNGECVARDAIGRDESQCPAASPSFPPFDEDPLLGCCTPENRCGYWDPTYGLGCMRAELFGISEANVSDCAY